MSHSIYSHNISHETAVVRGGGGGGGGGGDFIFALSRSRIYSA